MTQILDWICDLIEEQSEGAIKPVIGSLPPMGGVAIQQSSGNVIAPYFPRSQAIRETYVVNAKSDSQYTAMQLLETVHQILTKRTAYGETDDWQIITIRTLNTPDYLGQENNEAYLYGSSIEVSYFDRIQADNGEVTNE